MGLHQRLFKTSDSSQRNEPKRSLYYCTTI